MELFTGHWTLNHAASRFTMPAPMEWTQAIEVTAGGLRAYERIVAANGAVSEHAVDARFDGADYDVHGSPLVDTVAYTRPGPGQIDGIARKAGVEVFRETVTVTPDGLTLTTTISVQRSDGRTMDSVAVFDRVDAKD
jgi:hypothetical protein